MNIETIQWKANFANRGVKPDEAYKAIEKIRERSGGVVSADAVIETASRKNHILHPLFEWDDQAAAKEYRLVQARTLLRSFEITYAETPETPRRAYEVVSKKRPGDATNQTFYSTTEEAMNDPVARERLVAEAIRQAMAWRRRFHGLRELQVIVEAIDATVDQATEPVVA